MAELTKRVRTIRVALAAETRANPNMDGAARRLDAMLADLERAVAPVVTDTGEGNPNSQEARHG